MASAEREIRTMHSIWIDAVNAGDLARGRRTQYTLMPNKITAQNAGWPSQFRFAGHGFSSGVCEFYR